MDVQDRLRDQFDQVADRLPSPDLEAVLATGRRRRRQRTLTYSAGTVAAAAALAVAVTPLIHDGRSASNLKPAGHSQQASSPKPTAKNQNAVSDNPVGQRLKASVAAAAPELPAPSKVYPSDWNRNTPLPESQATNATEWQLYYDLPKGDTVLVYSSRKTPGFPASRTCPAAPPAGVPNDNLPCHTKQVRGGTLIDSVQQGINQQTNKPVNTQFLSFFVRSDGSVVNVRETVTNADPAAAARQRSLTDAQLERIATADGLGVPAPKVTPAPPTGP